MSGDSAAELARVFVARLAAGDPAGAFDLVAADAAVTIHPAGAVGDAAAARSFWEGSFISFPDLLIEVLHIGGFDDGRAIVRLRFEGTQADDFQGAINQEKHLDIEQAWVLRTDGSTITGITGYWDQNKLYRRLAVKRLDQIAIA